MAEHIDIKRLDTTVRFTGQSPDGMTFFGPAPADCTVGGCHATDLGFYQPAKHMAPVIENILTQ